METQEKWKKIEGWGGRYYVSSLGRVKSVYAGKERLLTLTPDGCGYPGVVLYFKRQYRHRPVHRLVAEAFCNRGREHTEVDHKNGIRSDNRASNLEWVSHRENMRRIYKFKQ